MTRQIYKLLFFMSALMLWGCSRSLTGSGPKSSFATLVANTHGPGAEPKNVTNKQSSI